MPDYVVAGAASIEDIPKFILATRQIGINVLLVENAEMLKQIPPEHRLMVTCTEEVSDTSVPFIPLNEFWVSKAIQAEVANISPHALRASRSKHYLSAQLSACGMLALPRSYLEDMSGPYPDSYLARLDAGYSGYGVVRHIEAGSFDPATITKMVQRGASASMCKVLDENICRVVIEDYLEGEEYSADVFIRAGRPIVLRLFRKIVVWIGGRPVCDSYIALPHTAVLCADIRSWCTALFSDKCTSFAQFDFIVVAGRAVAIDFSCRIGGGLSAIKRFAGITSYTAIALTGSVPYFKPFTVQKNVLSRHSGRLTNFFWHLPKEYKVTLQKKAGDLLPENICSANARVAEICFAASDFNNAIEISKALDSQVSIDVSN